ncbi:hypothetical protein [Plebeiibacterium sediminum]|uniref:Uncharacterized protein n=1 Tax=Plebeiibacterium sediminum TaxID=2992112 RepID=A0AAE3SDB0_9BACT|nr:hypothetical protein [Plebeiobacterium sediminum]MCW3784920.1 hypothetical protein [Plebeiobacterium sediminum]
MDLGTRKKALNALINVKHLEADKELLKAKRPHSHVFKRKYPTPERTHREVLWDLLNVASKEEIETNRKTFTSSKDEDEAKKAAELKTKQEKEAAEKEAKEKAEKEAKEKAEKEAAQKKITEAKTELIAMDLDNKPNYHRMVSIIATLDIVVENKEKETIVAALKAVKAELIKVDPVSEEEAKAKLKVLTLDMDTNYYLMKMLAEVLKIDVDLNNHKALVFALKEYRGDIVTVGNKDLEHENEDLKGELEDTKDQLEQTQEELEEMNAELDEAKKNEAQN